MISELFLEVSGGYKGTMSNEELKNEFDNGDKDAVIAFIYSKNYNYFNYAASSYKGIDEHTLEDIVLTQIWKCLKDYDASKSEGKITTMICTYIKYACRSYTQSQNTTTRIINQSHVSTVFSAFESTDKLEVMGNESNYSYIEMKQLIDQLDLSDNQREFCLCVIQEPDDIKMADIARELGLTRGGVNGIRRQLRTILKDAIA